MRIWVNSDIGFQETYDETNADSALEERCIDRFEEVITILIQISNSLSWVTSKPVLSNTKNYNFSCSKNPCN